MKTEANSVRPSRAENRKIIQLLVEAESMRQVARDLDVHPQTLASYLAGTARRLNAYWIEIKAERLGWITEGPTQP